MTSSWRQEETLIRHQREYFSAAADSGDEEAPSFVMPLTNQRVADGDRASFRVLLRGLPAPSVTWFYNSRPLTNSSDFQVSQRTLRTTPALQRNSSARFLLLARAVASAWCLFRYQPYRYHSSPYIKLNKSAVRFFIAQVIGVMFLIVSTTSLSFFTNLKLNKTSVLPKLMWVHVIFCKISIYLSWIQHTVPVPHP